MKYKELREALKNDFIEFLKPKGYKKAKSELQGCQFYLTDDSCQYTIGYGVANYEPIYKTGIYICLNPPNNWT